MEDTTIKKNLINLYETLGGTYRKENGHLLHWVAEMNNIKASAEEIVLQEVVLV